MKKIVVLGGSFNPPTKAHKKIMEEAVKRIDADLGIYLPADISYLLRSKKDVKENEILPNNIREKMLLSMHNDKKFIVEDYEFKTHNHSHTYESLKYIQNKYPDADVYFITGSDKLNIISRWHSAKSLLTEFKFLVVAREQDNITAIIEKNEKLKQHKDSFIQFSIPDEYLTVSSTKVRRAIRLKNLQELNTHLEDVVKDIYVEYFKLKK